MKHHSCLVIYLKMSLKTMISYPGISTQISIATDYSKWRGHLHSRRNYLEDSSPWMAFSAIRFIENKVNKKVTVFAFGSGGSKFYWSPRVEKIESVEYDAKRHELLQKEIMSRNIRNVEYNLIEADSGPNFTPKTISNPDDYVMSDTASVGMKYQNYASSIDKYPYNHFDFVVVNDRARPSCAAHAISKGKQNGLLVVDNTDCKHYLAEFDMNPQKWKKITIKGSTAYI